MPRKHTESNDEQVVNAVVADKRYARIGEVAIMNNGLKAEIVEYRNSADIDVKFENGAISYQKKYCNFKSKKIKCPMILEYIGDYVKVTNPNTLLPFSFLIDADDVGVLGNAFWHSSKSGYVYGNANGSLSLLHRLIMNAPDDMQVDHINGDKTDNRKRNLRICSASENMQNMMKCSKNTSGYKGVSWRKAYDKWEAQIGVGKKKIHLGYFESKTEAASAYDRAALLYHKEFANTNSVLERT